MNARPTAARVGFRVQGAVRNVAASNTGYRSFRLLLERTLNIGASPAAGRSPVSRYYELSEDYHHDHGITAGPKLPDRSVMAGEAIDGRLLPELRFEINVPDGAPCPHFMTGGTVIASDTLVAVLRSAGVDNFQCFPARLVNPHTGTERPGYQLFNVLGVGDLPRTGAEALAGGPDGLHMFRLADRRATLVVDEVVRDALVAGRPPGGWGILLEELG